MDFDFSPYRRAGPFCSAVCARRCFCRSFASAPVSSSALLQRLRASMAQRRCRWSLLYVDAMRSLPLLVVMVWIYFALPIITRRQPSAILVGRAGDHSPCHCDCDRNRQSWLGIHTARSKARRVGARHVGHSGDQEDHPAAGRHPHAARCWFGRFHHHQGYSDRNRHRRSRTDEAV